MALAMSIEHHKDLSQKAGAEAKGVREVVDLAIAGFVMSSVVPVEPQIK